MSLSQFYAVYGAARRGFAAWIARLPDWLVTAAFVIIFCLLMIDLFFLIRGLRHRRKD